MRWLTLGVLGVLDALACGAGEPIPSALVCGAGKPLPSALALPSAPRIG